MPEPFLYREAARLAGPRLLVEGAQDSRREPLFGAVRDSYGMIANPMQNSWICPAYGASRVLAGRAESAFRVNYDGRTVHSGDAKLFGSDHRNPESHGLWAPVSGRPG